MSILIEHVFSDLCRIVETSVEALLYYPQMWPGSRFDSRKSKFQLILIWGLHLTLSSFSLFSL